MKLIDIDKIEEKESHVHYIKVYKASVILMDKKAALSRYDIGFSIEYRPIGAPFINIKFDEHPHFATEELAESIKVKINDMEKNGDLHADHRKKNK